MFLPSLIKQFEYYKSLGEKTFDQLSDDQLFWQAHRESNSIGVIVKHLWGNMLSRWTDFLVSDGEKEWRDREAEFDADITTRTELLKKWNEGWNCLLDAPGSLEEGNLNQTIYIRNQEHSVEEAIYRQLAHYAYHVGQIVFIGRQQCGDDWQSLSIPRGGSVAYNEAKFSKGQHGGHFTDDV